MPFRHRKNPPNDKLARAVAYIAKAEDEATATLEEQHRIIEKDVEAHDAELVATCIETLDKPWLPPTKRSGLLDAIRLLQIHSAGVLIVADKSRLGVSVFDQILVQRLVADADAGVVAVSGGLSTCRTERAMVMDVLDVMEEYRRLLLKQRDADDCLALRRCSGWPLVDRPASEDQEIESPEDGEN